MAYYDGEIAVINATRMETASAVITPGTVIDRRYRIIREIGHGGMGTVYEAEDVRSRGSVAVKVMTSSGDVFDASALERFRREAKVLSSIKHRNVVDIVEFGELEGRVTYYVMELLEGRNLSSVIAEHGRLPWPRVRGILAQVLAALRAAHRKGVIHRDIKPANIVVLDRPDRWDHEQVKVLDFGIAKLQGADELSQALTKTSEILGTALYMAPELVLGEPPDARTDLYAIGVVAYQLLTGVTPFRSKNTFQLLSQHLKDDPVSLRAHVPGIPAAMDALVLRALAKKPDDRYHTAAQMRHALEELDEGSLGAAQGSDVDDADVTRLFRTYELVPTAMTISATPPPPSPSPSPSPPGLSPRLDPVPPASLLVARARGSDLELARARPVIAPANASHSRFPISPSPRRTANPGVTMVMVSILTMIAGFMAGVLVNS